MSARLHAYRQQPRMPGLIQPVPHLGLPVTDRYQKIINRLVRLDQTAAVVDQWRRTSSFVEGWAGLGMME
jgi:hypothetical protein